MSLLRYIIRSAVRAAGGFLPPKTGNGANVMDCVVTKPNGESVRLGDLYTGKVLLIVNVASKCGFTPQYEALEKLYERYHDRGFTVLAFPCNDFGAQEPGTHEEIERFCRTNYGVQFDLFGKVRVSGDDAAPLYGLLTSKANGKLAGAIRWNFTKFLVGRDGAVRARIEPPTPPDSPAVLGLIERELAVGR